MYQHIEQASSRVDVRLSAFDGYSLIGWEHWSTVGDRVIGIDSMVTPVGFRLVNCGIDFGLMRLADPVMHNYTYKSDRNKQ